MRFIIFSFCSSRIVLYKLFSSLRSYINNLSSTRAFEKSLTRVWPMVGAVSSSGESEYLERNDLVIWVMGEGAFGVVRVSKALFWKFEARFSRHERSITRSVNISSMGVEGANSASSRSWWRSKSA